MWVELVSTQAADGVQLHGALLPPTEGASHACDAVLCVPGVGGNFYSSTLQSEITPAFQAAGLHVLQVNTRGHDGMNTAITTGKRRRQGAAYEIVDECRFDVSAWLDFLNNRGLKRIAVFGHSLGAIKAVYAQSHAPHENVAALMVASPPRLSYKAFQNSNESTVFFESMDAANQSVAAGNPTALLEARFPFPLLITAEAYIDKYGPDERYNILHFADKLSVPTLFVYGEIELHSGVAFAGLPDALKRLSPPSRGFTIEVIPGADHFYHGKRVALADTAIQWLARVVAELG